MKVWSPARYAKYCKDTNEGLNDECADSGSDMDSIAREVADSCLDMEPGLREFLQKYGVKDVVGALADDICYPGNCKNYK